MGSLYRRKDSPYWWANFKDQFGVEHNESTKRKKHSDAKVYLSRREASVTRGDFYNIRMEDTTYDHLADLLIQDYKFNKRKSTHHTEKRIEVLSKHFTGVRAIMMPSMIKPFILKMQDDGYANGYINRFISAIHRMFTLGYEHNPRLVPEIPRIKKLAEDNVREGFFEHEDYLKLHAALPRHLRLALTVAYVSGVRVGEVFSIKLEQVDFHSGAIRLGQLSTKNKQPRVFYLTGEHYAELLEQQYELEHRYPHCKSLIHREGKPVKSFKDSWKTACEKAGIPGKLFHDLRRTAARNMLNAGVPEKWAMYIGGWKTRSIFDRYSIVNEDNLKEASYRVTEYLAEKSKQLKDGVDKT